MGKLAIIGASGFIGGHLAETCLHKGLAHLPVSRTGLDLARPDFDCLSLAREKVDTIIIAAAMANIQQCETYPEASGRVNVQGTSDLIDYVWQLDMLPVFLSSDYVFGTGEQADHRDNAPTTPNTAYGQQKAAVEQKMRGSGRPHLIVRLSKVYDTNRGSGTLLDELAVRITGQVACPAASDQVYCPTHVDDVVNGILMLLRHGMRGTVNLASPEVWSTYDLACAMARALGYAEEAVRKVSLADLFADSPRPKCTALLCERLPATMRFYRVQQSIDKLAKDYLHAQ